MRTRILLTAAIEPQSTFRLSLTDATVRRVQYLSSVQKWADWARRVGAQVTFMENSGHDLDTFANDAGLSEASHIDWVSVPTPPADVFSRGKGASEALMFDEFASLYADLDEELWIKVTGRLFVRNLSESLPDRIEDGFVARLSIALDHVDTRIIGATPRAWARYFNGMSAEIDERSDVRIEHVAARRILAGLGDWLTLTRFSRQPAIEGASGTWIGRNYGSPRAVAKRVLASQLDRVLRTALAHKHF